MIFRLIFITYMANTIFLKFQTDQRLIRKYWSSSVVKQFIYSYEELKNSSMDRSNLPKTSHIIYRLRFTTTSFDFIWMFTTCRKAVDINEVSRGL